MEDYIEEKRVNLFIDADSILYRAAHLADKKDDALEEAEALEDDDVEDISLDDLPTADNTEVARLLDMAKIFHSMANEIVEAVKTRYNIEKTYFVITVKPKLECCDGLADNFRYELMEDVTDPSVKGYKHNRAGKAVPDGLNDIYEYVAGLENTICESGVEADDVVVYHGRQGHIIAALDKDVIGSLEIAYNYGKREWVENNPIDVWKFPYLQTITGDTSDGLRGLYKVGSKGAEKALDNIVTDYEAWAEVVKLYAMKDQTMQEAIATMRCVRMDQWTPEKGLELWTAPKKQ